MGPKWVLLGVCVVGSEVEVIVVVWSEEGCWVLLCVEGHRRWQRKVWVVA